MERLRKRRWSAANSKSTLSSKNDDNDDKNNKNNKSKNNKNKCEICDKAFSRADTLSAHKRLHSKNPVKCSICSKTYSCKSKLVRHTAIHGKERHKCDKCKLSFGRVDSLDYHKRTVHFKNASFEKGIVELSVDARCDYCVGLGVRNHHLISVVRYGKPQIVHQCCICRKITNNHSLNWKHHMVDTQCGEKKREQNGFQCKRGCQRVFGSRKALKLHEKKRCYSLDSSEKFLDVAHLEKKMEAWRKKLIA